MIRKSLTLLTILNSNFNSFLFLLLKTKLSSFSMVCSCCNGTLSTPNHNIRTCPAVHEGWGPVPVKKVRKPFENLASCMNIFKEPPARKIKKVNKPLEGLAGCKNIFKEPKVVKTSTSKRNCSNCGGPGHNKRTCKVLTCHPCVVQCERPNIISKDTAITLLAACMSDRRNHLGEPLLTRSVSC